MWAECRNCDPKHPKCTVSGIIEDLKKPLPMDLMVVKDESGKSADELRALGFTVIECSDGIYRTFNEAEKEKLGIRSAEPAPKPRSKRQTGWQRLYGSGPECPIRIRFGPAPA